MQISKVEFGSLLTYTPRGKLTEHFRSRTVMRNLKNDEVLQSGWICIKIYNNIEQKINCCFGFINTNDDGQFPLYDYESYLRDKKENDLDLSFSLEPNSTKLLYSEIKGGKDHIKVILDTGKEEITKELSLDTNSFSDNHLE